MRKGRRENNKILEEEGNDTNSGEGGNSRMRREDNKIVEEEEERNEIEKGEG